MPKPASHHIPFYFYFASLIFLYAATPASASEKSKMNRQLNLCYVIEYGAYAAKSYTIESGIRVNLIFMNGSGATLARLKVERDAPRCDVWLGGSLGSHAQAAYEGLTESYRPQNFDKMDPRFRDPLGNNRVTGIYWAPLVFLVNPNYFVEKGIPAPSSWSDLVNPQYKGMIALKNPVVSGTGYTVLSTLIQMQGEEKAFTYMEALKRNISDIPSRHAVMVSDGRIGIAVTFSHEAFNKNVKILAPKEGSGYEIGGLSLVKNSPNANEAKHFIDYIVSEKGAELMQRFGGQRLPVWQDHNNNSVKPDHAKVLNSIKLIKFDFVWSGKNRQRLIERYKRDVVKNK